MVGQICVAPSLRSAAASGASRPSAKISPLRKFDNTHFAARVFLDQIGKYGPWWYKVVPKWYQFYLFETGAAGIEK